MNICIVHDSETGNGERLANAIRDRLSGAGHTVTVGHERTLVASQAVASRPDLLIVGTAVRRFALSPVTKNWIDALADALSGSDVTPRAAVFVTHALKKEATERKGRRIHDRLVDALNDASVYPGWISARVVGVEGPFEEGVEDEVMQQIDAVVSWAAAPRTGTPQPE